MLARPAVGQLLAVVGTNPLPAMLATLSLQPRALTLVASTQTTTIAQRIASVLPEMLPSAVLIVPVADLATTCSHVVDAISASTEDPALTFVSYVGGSQAMALGTVLGLAAATGHDVTARCAAVSEHDDRITLGDGRSVPIAWRPRGGTECVPVGLREIAVLHGRRVHDVTRSTVAPLTGAELRRLTQIVKGGRPTASAPTDPGALLARAVGRLARLVGVEEVRVGVTLAAHGDDRKTLEIDVVCRHRLRVAVISCTIAKDDDALRKREIAAAQAAVAIGGCRASAAAIGRRGTRTRGHVRDVASAQRQLADTERGATTTVVFGADALAEVLDVLADQSRIATAARATQLGAWLVARLRIADRHRR